VLLGDSSVNLWTIQNAVYWRRQQCNGQLVVDPPFEGPDDPWAYAYEWMRQQMNRRIPGGPHGYPIWAWPTKPDLREAGHLPKGAPGVRVEFIAPSREVLFSDFDSWHSILCLQPITLNEEESNEFDLDVEISGVAAIPHPRVRATWDRVFELDVPASDPWRGLESPRVQAVVPRLHLSQVVRVDSFVAR